MNPNKSPWIHQVNRTRPVVRLVDHISTDVAIIGAGIAGISTAFFVLKNTDRKVTIIEGNKVAHGATGHNAGQLVSYFERQFAGLVKEFGLEKTAEAQNAVDSAWHLIDEMFADAKLKTPFHQFTGYAGCGSLEEILFHLENSKYATQANIYTEDMMIAEESGIASKIPAEYREFYSIVPQKGILSLLETNDPHYIAAIATKKGCMNSALFCEEVLGFLISQYPDRLMLAEETPIKEVILEKGQATLLTQSDHEIKASHVVLCTNGFEKFKVTDKFGDPEAVAKGKEALDEKFHRQVKGSIGYMAGYLEARDKPPIAISYLPDHIAQNSNAFESDPYFYVTRRPFEIEKNESHNLICIGGPESLLDDTNSYSKEHAYPEEAQKSIDEFLHRTWKSAPEKIDYKYKWHGLMGYTPSGVRIIGPEPRNPVLLYNLGCNGVGILPSVYGGQKVAWFLAGKEMPPSIFDARE